ncbi:MAG: hypothetical protein IJN08_05115, partial [Clostridia bacterium]|nr:hypothetical protein [Clostridia bacterium]
RGGALPPQGPQAPVFRWLRSLNGCSVPWCTCFVVDFTSSFLFLFVSKRNKKRSKRKRKDKGLKVVSVQVCFIVLSEFGLRGSPNSG